MSWIYMGIKHTMTTDQLFTKVDYTAQQLPMGKYDNCTFRNCNFAKADLAASVFAECIFEQCDLSMANVTETAFRDVTFKECKLMGVKWQDCHNILLSFHFEDCDLNFSSFFRLTIKHTNFVNCTLEEVEFAEADLSHAVFDNCDMRRSNFEGTVLEKADLRTAYHFSIDPEGNRLKKAKFSRANLMGLLDKYAIIIE